jgi:hypothetical protein
MYKHYNNTWNIATQVQSLIAEYTIMFQYTSIRTLHNYGSLEQKTFLKSINKIELLRAENLLVIELCRATWILHQKIQERKQWTPAQEMVNYQYYQHID